MENQKNNDLIKWCESIFGGIYILCKNVITNSFFRWVFLFLLVNFSFTNLIKRFESSETTKEYSFFLTSIIGICVLNLSFMVFVYKMACINKEVSVKKVATTSSPSEAK